MAQRVQTFVVSGTEPCMGYVPGEQFTVVDLDKDREAKYLNDGSLKFVSGDQPHTTKKTESPKGQK